MSLWKIAWRSIQQRTLASALTAISMALGVSLVVAVLVVYGVVKHSLQRGGEGYDLVIGPSKGSPLDLVLNSVYYMRQPKELLPYEYYQQILTGDIADGVGTPELAVPVCLGDTYNGYPVVGTTPDMFDAAIQLPGGQHYRFAEGGRNFKSENFFEAVAGATAARKMGLKIGSTFSPTHDVGPHKGHKHEPCTVVGILEPSGTPNDRALFVNMEGFFRQPGHLDSGGEHDENAEHAEHGEHPDHDEAAEHGDHEHDKVIPDKLKPVTAVLVCLKDPNRTRTVASLINHGNKAQAAIPGDEISRLFEGLVGDLQLVLLLFAVMIVIVAGVGIMVSIYNSMSDRRQEIAVMRALGADRMTIMLVVLLESILLSLGGGVLGLLLGHGVVELLSPLIADRIHVAVNLLEFRMTELYLIPALIVLASVVGYLPALAAYRTDVARSLMSAP